MHEIQKHKRHALCNLIHCFKSFAVFYFQVHSFNPFEEGKQPFVLALNSELVI